LSEFYPSILNCTTVVVSAAAIAAMQV
jgi:hypothetical protein